MRAQILECIEGQFRGNLLADCSSVSDPHIIGLTIGNNQSANQIYRLVHSLNGRAILPVERDAESEHLCFKPSKITAFSKMDDNVSSTREPAHFEDRNQDVADLGAHPANKR